MEAQKTVKPMLYKGLNYRRIVAKGEYLEQDPMVKLFQVESPNTNIKKLPFSTGGLKWLTGYSYTICPKSLDPFVIVSLYMKQVNTS